MFIGKTKKFLSLLASLAMMVTAVTGAMSVSAETDSGECGEVKWSFDSSTGKLTISGEGEMASPAVTNQSKGTGSRDDIIKPQLKDYKDIYTYKKYKDNIKEVIIEEGVTAIGFCAFYQMSSIETVILPSTIREFKGVGYDSVNVSVDDKAVDILSYASCAFAECTKLKNLTLTEGMTAIGSIAFYGCTALESVRIPSTILRESSIDYPDHYENNGKGDLKANFGWGPYSFVGCTSLKNITLPEGLKVIGGCAFEDTGVESVVIPSTIETLASVFSEVPTNTVPQGCVYGAYSSTFANCKKLTSVTLSDGIKTIGDSAFWGCPLLKRISIPKSVTSMYKAFAYCTGFQEVYIEDGAQISDGKNNFEFAFNNCTNLKKLEIPSGVEIDYNNARWCTGCSSLTDLYIHGKDYSYFPVSNNMSRVHCYSGTETYNSLMKNGIGGPRLVDIEEEIENTREELNKAVTEAEKYAEEDYTPESYGVLKALLEKAGKYGEDPSVMSMEDTTEGIYAAIDGLVDKSNEPSSSDPSSSDPSDSSNPSDKSSDPSNSSDNNNQSQSPNTPATPSTAAPTTATPKPTTPPTVTTAAKPAQVKAVKVKSKKKKLKVSWKKVSGATGYEVLLATNNKFTKNKKTVTVKKNKVTLKKLKPKKKYFVKVRAYKLANGRKYFGKWSKVVKKKTK